jgi:hypothetical protein
MAAMQIPGFAPCPLPPIDGHYLGGIWAENAGLKT